MSLIPKGSSVNYIVKCKEKVKWSISQGQSDFNTHLIRSITIHCSADPDIELSLCHWRRGSNRTKTQPGRNINSVFPYSSFLAFTSWACNVNLAIQQYSMYKFLSTFANIMALNR